MACCAGHSQAASSSIYSQIPQTGYLLFDNAPSSQAILKKLREFSQSLRASSNHKDLALTEEQSSSGLDHLVARYGHSY